MAIVKGAGLVMKAIIEVNYELKFFLIVFTMIVFILTSLSDFQEGDKEIATKMQELALSEGALPRHLHTSLFTISADQRMLTNRSSPPQKSHVQPYFCVCIRSYWNYICIATFIN